MTNAPADLLGLRTQLQQLTGLGADEVGIVGNQAHRASGGYHEGSDDLHAAGVWSTDYSVRLPRDRAGCTLSASATDVGANWRQGRAVWIRWNQLLANALRADEPALAAVRAINYSPDGTTKWRLDREFGWKTASTSDTVTIHTHIEWYRDTEGKRQASLDRIVALASQAITGQVVLASTITKEDTVFLAIDQGGTVYACDGMHSRAFTDPKHVTDFKTLVGEGLITLAGAGKPPRGGWYEEGFGELGNRAAVVAMSPADRDAVTAALAGLVPTVEELASTVDAAVKARLDGAVIHTAGT